MKEQLISFKTAKIANILKFYLPCMFWFNSMGKPNAYCHGNPIWRPTQSLLQKWLREEYKIILLVDWNNSFGYYYKIIKYSKGKEIYFNTYEEALEAGLYEALKIVKRE